MTDEFPDIRHRSFVAIATAEYDYLQPQLGGVVDEVATFTDWLCGRPDDARKFTHVYPELAENPTVRQVEDALKEPEREWTDRDAVVVFITGHGLRTDDGHWIAVRATNPAYPRRTAISTADLIGWLRECPIDHIMVIVDLCYAGAAARHTVQLPPFPPTWIVLASTGADDPAMVGALTNAVRGFLDDLATPVGEQFQHGPYLHSGQFRAAIMERLPGQQLHYLTTAAPYDGFSPCLPNPHYRKAPELLEPARRDLAIRPEDLIDYWEPKARGSDVGWLFTGRAVLIERLIAFLREEPSALVVTGAAGTGKSAVLGRLVIFTDRRFRRDQADLVEAVPPTLQPDVGAVDCAVLATGKSSDVVLQQIMEAVGIDVDARPPIETPIERWRSWTSTRSEPVTLVIDALDEATNPKALFDEVVVPIFRRSAPHSVRLIVGVRGPSTDGSFDPAPVGEAKQAFSEYVVEELRAERLDVGIPPYWQLADLVGFATDILLRTPGSPYAEGHARLAERVAEVIADRVQPSFLVTRLAAELLARGKSVIDPDDPDWHRTLDNGLLGVFRADLRTVRPQPADRLKTVHLLRAVAFAYGRGLPWSQVWPLVANAIADRPSTYGDSDVAELLGSRLNGYLVTDHENGYTVYRLFHDALRATLRDSWAALLRDDD